MADAAAAIGNSDSAADARQRLTALMARKADLEAEIEALSSGGPSGGAAIGQRLVDSEGFPRGDLDVHAVRHARQSLAQLQTDHLAVMKSIETDMYKLHAEAKRNKAAAGVASPAAKSVATNENAPANIAETKTTTVTAATVAIMHVPAPAAQPQAPRYTLADAFFLVDSVSQDSPSAVSGLQVGDHIVSFGSISKRNNSKNAMRTIVSNSRGRAIPVTVLRDRERIVQLSLTPQTWSGPGLLGCHLTDI